MNAAQRHMVPVFARWLVDVHTGPLPIGIETDLTVALLAAARDVLSPWQRTSQVEERVEIDGLRRKGGPVSEELRALRELCLGQTLTVPVSSEVPIRRRAWYSARRDGRRYRISRAEDGVRVERIE